MSKPDIVFILEREPTASLGYRLMGCRGEGKGCTRNLHRRKAKSCADCLPADDNETLAQFKARLERGDA